MNKRKQLPFIADDVLRQLPTLPENQYWVIGNQEGWRYDPSGIRREYGGSDWVPSFGVALYQKRSFLKVFKWADARRYKGEVKRTEADVIRVARLLLDEDRKARFAKSV